MSSTVTATEFILIDEIGQRKAVLGCVPTGQPALLFYDKDEKARLSIVLDEDDNATFILSDSSRWRIALTLDDDAGPSLTFSDREGNVRLRLCHSGDEESPAIILRDRDGREGKVIIRLNAEGEPIITGEDGSGLRIFDGS